jgi:tetratricopeptide (TPR) repeat protein
MGRKDEAVAAMLAMIDLEDGGTEELTELVDWLVEQKAWSVIDQVAKRFDAQFRNDWSLLYLLAEARQAQGKTDEARELAERAFQLGGEEPTRHWRAAAYLQQRGQYAWAEAEYRKVIEIGPRGSRPALYAARWLAEMLHDQGADQKAGEALKEIADLMERDPAIVQAVQRINLAPEELRARMEYFFAEAAARQKDFAKQKEHLDRAVAQAPTDADVLIAMYHLPGASDEYRAKTKKLIANAAAEFEQQIENAPDDASGYNQYAWLIGNTEGDLDKAIRYSHRSLELMPNTAGYLDTLGHAYYTKGDYENAVRYQQQAADLDPHAGLITRPLKKFKAALEKQREQSGSRKAKSGAGE